MKTTIAAVVLAASVAMAGGKVHVDGYVKKSNGQYVEPHVRTAPDNTEKNNYSTEGNYNPYTGQEGTKKAKK